MKVLIDLKAYLDKIVMPFLGAFVLTSVCSIVLAGILCGGGNGSNLVVVLIAVFAAATLAGVISVCTSQVIYKLNEIKEAISETKGK